MLFCHGARGTALIVTALEERDMPTDVRLRLMADEPYAPCVPRRYERPNLLSRSSPALRRLLARVS